jgi:hypothetical protein
MEVNLVDQAGRNIRVRLPDDVPVGQLSSAIRRQLNLPDNDERGRLQLVLHHKVSGRDLPPERSLGEEKVGEGDVLRLRMEAVAG